MPEPRAPMRWGFHLTNAVTAIVSVIWLLPLVFGILMSIRPASQPVTNGNIFFDCSERSAVLAAERGDLSLLGCTITGQNYADAWAVAPWPLHYRNSLIFVVGVLIVQLFTVTMAGYAFARMRFAGRNLLLFLILLQIMIPTGVLLVQNFSTIRSLGLFNTHWALMAPYWGSAFGTLLIRQTFREVPLEFEEAARIDGANLWQVLRHVYVPLSIPAYLSFALVSVSSHWTEFLWPFIVTRSDDVRPLTVALSQLYKTSETGALYGQLMAGTLLVVAPLVVLFMLFQRRFIESFASSGLK